MFATTLLVAIKPKKYVFRVNFAKGFIVCDKTPKERLETSFLDIEQLAIVKLFEIK